MQNPDLNKEQMMKDLDEKIKSERRIEEQRRKVRGQAGRNTSQGIQSKIDNSNSSLGILNDQSRDEEFESSNDDAPSDSESDFNEDNHHHQTAQTRKKQVQMMEESD